MSRRPACAPPRTAHAHTMLQLTLLLLTTVVSHGIDAVDTQMSDEQAYPLIFAAGEADSASVTALLETGSDVTARSKDGETALHVCAIKGDVEITKALLAHGAEVDARTPKGETLWMTPLMWATYGGHAAMVRLLLAAGADPLAIDEKGKAVLQMSRDARHPDVEALLLAAIDLVDLVTHRSILEAIRDKQPQDSETKAEL